ncbi:hypothetical protein [Qipengyuania aquimaris]|uniref:Secreted protein n=1 Tax=Qipengyuania aquimaris TaxID=255984 RepID=A0A9Q3S211_9SPHN|nr:hypothetical protein [Qipengyuania aquimaris]MBY6218567.1 hypothetical protein [Qipengyuania aquimaris]
MHIRPALYLFGAAAFLGASGISLADSGEGGPSFVQRGECAKGKPGQNVYLKNNTDRRIRVTYRISYRDYKGKAIKRERFKVLAGGRESRVGCSQVNNGSPTGHGSTKATYKIVKWS